MVAGGMRAGVGHHLAASDEPAGGAVPGGRRPPCCVAVRQRRRRRALRRGHCHRPGARRAARRAHARWAARGAGDLLTRTGDATRGATCLREALQHFSAADDHLAAMPWAGRRPWATSSQDWWAPPAILRSRPLALPPLCAGCVGHSLADTAGTRPKPRKEPRPQLPIARPTPAWGPWATRSRRRRLARRCSGRTCRVSSDHHQSSTVGARPAVRRVPPAPCGAC